MGRARASVHKGQKCDEHGRSCEADNINGVLEFSLRFSVVCALNSHGEAQSRARLTEKEERLLDE